MAELPTGTVTFLFTDIEGSTKLWQQFPDAMPTALARHHAMLQQAIESHGGYVFQVIGDAFCAAFHNTADALRAALAAQRALQAEAWGETPVRVRMAVHTGSAEVHKGEYQSGEYVSGLTLSRAARLLSAGHGGQVLVSRPTTELLLDQLPAQTRLRDLGEHRLKDLIRPEHIFQVVTPDLPADFPPVRSLDTLPNNLPRQLSSFIGRERELLEVKQLLMATRLLTLTGAGGSGKTRLALQVAAEVVDLYPHGTWFVSLASLSDPVLVPQALANVLALREDAGRPLFEVLTDYLRSKELLLVLDNCEHVIDACAQLVLSLLQTCPDLQLLATSREALNVEGEAVWLVPTLAVPPVTFEAMSTLAPYDSVQLFVDRAAMVLPGFALTGQNASGIAAICRRLEGIPLALELAAARVKTLSVDQITARLDHAFRLLTEGRRGAPTRHQTLRATMDWSYGLLSEQEQTLFSRLAVFAGGWTLEAAERVWSDGEGPTTNDDGKPANRSRASFAAHPAPDRVIRPDDVLDLLNRLVVKSLVLVTERVGETRYRLLEPVQQYALVQLSGSEGVQLTRDRHLAFYQQLATEAEPNLKGANQQQWFDRLEPEHDNLRAALRWSLAGGNIVAGLQLAGALQWFWAMHGYLTEGQAWLEQILARSGGAPPALRAKALTGAGTLAWSQSDVDRAVAYHTESLAISRQLGDPHGIAESLNNLGGQAFYRGDSERAAQLMHESLGLARQAGDKWQIAVALTNLGEVRRHQRQIDQAVTWIEEGLALFREIGDQHSAAWALQNLALATTDQGDFRRALALHQEALAHLRDAAYKYFIPFSLEGVAKVSGELRQPELAARLLGAAAALRQAINAPMPPADQPDHVHVAFAVRAQLGDVTFETLWSAGRMLSVEQAAALALEAITKITTLPAAVALEKPAQSRVGPSHLDELTPREVEVLRLVATGLTTNQIAAQLVLSMHTVQAHLRSIYSKLGVTNRSAATRYAIEHHLE